MKTPTKTLIEDTPTPRTDAYDTGPAAWRGMTGLLLEARQLERELAAEKREVEALRNHVEQWERCAQMFLEGDTDFAKDRANELKGTK